MSHGAPEIPTLKELVRNYDNLVEDSTRVMLRNQGDLPGASDRYAGSVGVSGIAVEAMAGEARGRRPGASGLAVDATGRAARAEGSNCRSARCVAPHWTARQMLATKPPRSFRIQLMSYEDIITIEPGKRGGQPCIRGMRITVYDVLSYLASGMTEEEILSDFPYLTREDILACLSYAAEREHRMLVSNE